MTMATEKITVSDWTRYPGGRFIKDGEYSGEEFRIKYIDEPLAQGHDFEIDFNGIFTVGWSFLDQAFGEFIEKNGEAKFRETFQIIADDDPDILIELQTVIDRRLGKR